MVVSKKAVFESLGGSKNKEGNSDSNSTALVFQESFSKNWDKNSNFIIKIGGWIRVARPTH